MADIPYGHTTYRGGPTFTIYFSSNNLETGGKVTDPINVYDLYDKGVVDVDTGDAVPCDISTNIEVSEGDIDG